MAYAPAPVPNDPKQWPLYLRSEFERIAAELKPTTLQLQVSYVAPAKPRDGLLLVADGTHLNLGSGAGAYVYYNGAWHYLG